MINLDKCSISGLPEVFIWRLLRCAELHQRSPNSWLWGLAPAFSPWPSSLDWKCKYLVTNFKMWQKTLTGVKNEIRINFGWKFEIGQQERRGADSGGSGDLQGKLSKGFLDKSLHHQLSFSGSDQPVQSSDEHACTLRWYKYQVHPHHDHHDHHYPIPKPVQYTLVQYDRLELSKSKLL